MSDRKFIEGLALELLDSEGVEAIWNLHTVAAQAYRDGQLKIAAGFIEIADTAEREWQRRRQGV